MRRRIPWVPLVISIVVLLSSGLAVQPVRDAATLGDVAEAYLTRSMGYVAMAPLSNTLDTLTLLSARQHIALVLGLLVLFAVWRLVKSRGAASPSGWRGHLMATIVLVLGIVATYAAAAALPRPMAALVADNANILIADFHSHTSASHDVRSAWSAGRNRAWHAGAGFHVSFITDHGAVGGAEQGMANNPAPAGAGVTLLQSIEVTWNGEHVSILGAERTYKGLLTANLRDIDEQGLALASLVPGRQPIVVWNHPRDLNRLPAAQPGGVGVRAIEVVNGAPADMDRVRPQRAAIVAFAEKNSLALTSGSDNHGWGRSVPGWTIMNLLNWRALQGDALALRIEGAMRESGFMSTRVIERRVADPSSPPGVGFTVLSVPMRMLTTLSNEERVVWLVWTWAIWSVLRFRRRIPRPAT